MSWFRALFESRPLPPDASRHLGVLVRGTLWHAESAILQLKMQRIEEGMTGAASVFGGPDGLEAQTTKREWVSLSALKGRWILVIPEDAYARYGPEFDRAIGGRPLDGRTKSTGAIGGFELLNLSSEAEKDLCALIARMPPLPPPPGRVTVGACTECGRDLRVKAHAVRPTLHLTCKCGAKNTVTVAGDQASEQTSSASSS